jgi:uncharacterized membrane protein YfcA
LAPAAWRIVRVAAPIGIIGALAASEVHDSALLASYAILVASLAVVTWRNSVTHDSAKSTRTESVRRELTDSRGHTYEYFDPRLGPRSVALTATGAFLTGMVSVGIGEVTIAQLARKGIPIAVAAATSVLVVIVTVLFASTTCHATCDQRVIRDSRCCDDDSCLPKTGTDWPVNDLVSSHSTSS